MPSPAAFLRLRPVALRLAVALAAGGFALSAVELGLRLARPGSAHALDNAAFTRASKRPGQMTELVPGSENPDFAGGAVSINALGFRGPELTEQKADGVYRVLAVGDSVTFGYGVPEDATFHRRAAAVVEANGGGRIEVANAGLPSAGMPYYPHVTRRWCRSLQVDLVTVGVVLNDIAEYPPEVLDEAPLPRARAQADQVATPTVLRQSYAYVLGLRSLKGVLYAVGALSLKHSPGYRFIPLEPASPAVEAAWSSSLTVLQAAVQAARDCGADVLVTLMPVEVQLSESALAEYRDGLGVRLSATATDLEPQRRLAAWAAAGNVPFLDFTPAFLHHDPSLLFLRDLYVSLDPVHPSVLGHAQAAGLFAEALAPRVAARRE